MITIPLTPHSSAYIEFNIVAVFILVEEYLYLTFGGIILRWLHPLCSVLWLILCLISIPPQSYAPVSRSIVLYLHDVRLIKCLLISYQAILSHILRCLKLYPMMTYRNCAFFSFYQARALRALGLLLADGAPTVGGGKTF